MGASVSMACIATNWIYTTWHGMPWWCRFMFEKNKIWHLHTCSITNSIAVAPVCALACTPGFMDLSAKIGKLGTPPTA